MSEKLEHENEEKKDDCGCHKFSIPCKCVDGKPTFPKIPTNG